MTKTMDRKTMVFKKDPICTLMEYAAASKIQVAFTDPIKAGFDHAPRFKTSAIIDGKVLTNGEGINKKISKKHAALIALECLNLVKPQSDSIIPNGVCNGDSHPDLLSDTAERDPVSELVEYAHSIRASVGFTDIVRTGPDHRPKFSTSAVLNGMVYPAGIAEQKKHAKKQAARLALLVIEDEQKSAESSPNTSFEEEHSHDIDGKHPTSVLMEHAQQTGLKVTFEPYRTDGLDHIPTFCTCVIVNGKKLPEGRGTSKKDAKKIAAYNAVQILKQRKIRNAADLENIGLPSVEQDDENDVEVPSSFDIDGILGDLGKDPVCALQEYCVPRGLTVSYDQSPPAGPPHSPIFAMRCVIGGKKYPKRQSKQKQIAKKEASKIALATILNEAQNRLYQANRIAVESLGQPQSYEKWEDYAAALSHKVLEIVQEAQTDKYVKEKVLATVLIRVSSQDSGRVISLGTGNRCILGKHLTKDGCKVNHSHAEIIARRGLLRFLYKELLGCDGEQTESRLFQKSKNGKLKIKPTIRLTLYISRPPCGDASAFINISDSPLKRKARERQGILRTIMEDGEGAIPSSSEPASANYDELVSGRQRLRVMTCSDKICSWTVVGVQGALLSYFLEPVYLHSVAVGSYVGQQDQHLPRAVSKRLSRTVSPRAQNNDHRLVPLQTPYRLTQPYILISNSQPDIYDLPNSRPYSVNWTIGDTTVEVIDGMLGQKVAGEGSTEMSRIGKSSLFSLFMEICSNRGISNRIKQSYHETKQAATVYKRSKEILFSWFEVLDYGPWIHLPCDIDMFPDVPE